MKYVGRILWALILCGPLLWALAACAPARVLLDGELDTDRNTSGSAFLQWDTPMGYVDAGVVHDPLYGPKPRGVVRAGVTVDLQ